MTVQIVSFVALGSKCWSSLRFCGQCHRCSRYDTCAYPERTATVAYDETRAKAKALRDQSDALYASLKEI